MDWIDPGKELPKTKIYIQSIQNSISEMKSNKKSDIFRIPIKQWKLYIFLIILFVVLNTLGLGCMCGSDTNNKKDGKESVEDKLNNAAQALNQVQQTLCGNSGLGIKALCGGDGSTSNNGITDLCVNCPAGDAGAQCRQVCSDVVAPTLKGTKLVEGTKFTYSYEFSMSVTKDTVYYLSFVTSSGTKKELCSGTALSGSFAQCAKESEKMDADYSKICVDYWQGSDQKNKCEDIVASSAPVVDTGGITGGDMTGPGEFTIKQGEKFTLTIPVSSPDCTDAVGCFTFSATATPPVSSNFKIDQMTGKIDFTPLQEDVGDHTITIAIVDKDSHKTSVPLLFHVLDVNDAPVLDLNDISLAENGTAEVNLRQYASDPDGTSNFIFGYTPNPDSKLSIVIDNSTAKISVAQQYWHGEEEVEFTVSDGQSTSSQKVKVTVTATPNAPWFEPPVPTILANEDFGTMSVDLKSHLKDDDDTPDKITVALGSDFNSSKITASVTGTTLKIDSVQDMNGDVDIPITLTDSEGNSATYSVKMSIKPVNDAPIVSDISDIMLDNTTTSYTLNLSSIIKDPDNPMSDIRVAFRYNAPEIKITYNPADQTAKFEKNGNYPPNSKMIEVIATDFGATGSKFVDVVWS